MHRGGAHRVGAQGGRTGWSHRLVAQGRGTGWGHRLVAKASCTGWSGVCVMAVAQLHHMLPDERLKVV